MPSLIWPIFIPNATSPIARLNAAPVGIDKNVATTPTVPAEVPKNNLASSFF